MREADSPVLSQFVVGVTLMSLRLQPFAPFPTTPPESRGPTFPNGHPPLRLRDELGPLFSGKPCRTVSTCGQPPRLPGDWR